MRVDKAGDAQHRGRVSSRLRSGRQAPMTSFEHSDGTAAGIACLACCPGRTLAHGTACRPRPACETVLSSWHSGALPGARGNLGLASGITSSFWISWFPPSLTTGSPRPLGSESSPDGAQMARGEPVPAQRPTPHALLRLRRNAGLTCLEKRQVNPD